MNNKKEQQISIIYIPFLNQYVIKEDFINDDKYKEYFLSNKERWKLNLERVKNI